MTYHQSVRVKVDQSITLRNTAVIIQAFLNKDTASSPGSTQLNASQTMQPVLINQCCGAGLLSLASEANFHNFDC